MNAMNECCCGRAFEKAFGLRVHQRTCPDELARVAPKPAQDEHAIGARVRRLYEPIGDAGQPVTAPATVYDVLRKVTGELVAYSLRLDDGTELRAVAPSEVLPATDQID